MDWFTQGVITGVVSNVLTGFAPQIGATEEAQTKLQKIGTTLAKDSDLTALFRNAATEAASTLNLDKRASDKVRSFLTTPEAQSVIRQAYSLQLTTGKQSSLDGIREVFTQSLALCLGKTPPKFPEFSKILFDAVIAACNRVLDTAIREGILAAHSAASTYQMRLLQDEIANVASNLAFRANKSNLDFEKIVEFEKKYRKQVGNANKYITPPSLEGAKKVPIDQLFVASNFSRPPRTKKEEVRDLTTKDFLAISYRAIILGNPGGGKSTFARKLCHDLATQYGSGLFAGRDLSPILVTLRDYAAEKKGRGLSILQFMEFTCNSDFGIAPPPGVFEYLLLNGRAIVIFDGLDELLETNDRQRITRDVELFGDLYPSTPIIVTSREVGYEQAPLAEERFEIFRLAPFSAEHVTSYVHKWFATNTDLTPSDQKKQATFFLEESQIVPDLRSNPLMLALMCTIYRGEGTIPRNRPDVYSKCAEMLFEKWDKRRGIHVLLPFEAHVRPAMNHLAAWIYSDEKLQRGVPESGLVEEATRYLNKWCFDDLHEAEAAANRFIEFCSGRAWVFTDTGTRKGGERLYQFTHRTFLEYFTAVHIVQTHRTPQELGDLLHPHIAKREWDIVAQLAFQLKGRGFQGDTDALLTGLLSAARSNGEEQCWNFMMFAARSLEFMVPTPPLRRQITNECLTRALEWAERRSSAGVDRDPDEIAIATIGDLLSASVENRGVIADALRVVLIDRIDNCSESKSALAVELVWHLSFALHSRRLFTPGGEDLTAYWDNVSEGIKETCADRILALAKVSLPVAMDCLWRDLVTIDELVQWHGVKALFFERQFVFFGGVGLSIAAYLSRVVTEWPRDESSATQLERDFARARDVRRILLTMPPPWAIFGSHVSTGTLEWVLRGDSYHASKPSKSTVTPDPRTMFGLFLMIASIMEAARETEGFSLPTRSRNPLIVKLRPLLTAKISGDRITGENEAERLGFNEDELSFVRQWLSPEFRLVSESNHAVRQRTAEK